MFASLNLPKLINKVRLLSDKRGSQFVTDQEITDLLGDSFDLLYLKLIDLNEGYYTKQTEELSPTNGNELQLPLDMYKLRLVKNVSCDRVLPEKTLREVEGINGNWYDWLSVSSQYGYVLFPNHIRIYPKESAGGSKYQLTYARDTLDIESESIQKGWEKYLSYKTAYTVTAIEDNPRVSLLDLAKEWQDKVIEFAAVRDSSPKTVVDVESGNPYGGPW